jgi:WD40 repeat protein
MEPSTGKATELLPGTDYVTSFDYDENNTLVCVDESGLIQTLTLDGSSVPTQMARDTVAINAVKFKAASGKHVITAGASPTAQLKIWDFDTNQGAVHEFKDPSRGVSYHSVAIHDTKPNQVAAGSSDGTVVLWDIRQPREPCSRGSGHASNVWGVKFRQSNQIISCGEDGQLLSMEIDQSQSNELASTPLYPQHQNAGADVGLPLNCVDVCSINGEEVRKRHTPLAASCTN